MPINEATGGHRGVVNKNKSRGEEGYYQRGGRLVIHAAELQTGNVIILSPLDVKTHTCAALLTYYVCISKSTSSCIDGDGPVWGWRGWIFKFTISYSGNSSLNIPQSSPPPAPPVSRRPWPLGHSRRLSSPLLKRRPIAQLPQRLQICRSWEMRPRQQRLLLLLLMAQIQQQLLLHPHPRGGGVSTYRRRLHFLSYDCHAYRRTAYLEAPGNI